MRSIDADALIEKCGEWYVEEGPEDGFIGTLGQLLSGQPEINCSEIPNNSDVISRQAAIDALRKMQTYKLFAGDDMLLIDQAEAQTELMMLPSIQPEQRWIPVEERLPEEPYGCLVTVWDTNPITMDEFENTLPYFVGWDGEQWNDGDGEQCPFEVIAWMPLPEPARLE